MARGVAKFVLRLPDDLFREIERARKKSGRTRSALVQDALRLWLRSQGEATLVRQWEDRYRRMPETPAEIESAVATTRFAFADEDDW